MSTAYFNSTENYLKRDASSNKSTMLGPNASAYAGYIFQRTTIIPHNLGYVPLVHVYYEPFGDGTVYPITSTQLNQFANNPLPTGNAFGPGLLYWVDSTNLNIRLYYNDASLANTSFPIYYVVYKDYQVA